MWLWFASVANSAKCLLLDQVYYAYPVSDLWPLKPLPCDACECIPAVVQYCPTALLLSTHCCCPTACAAATHQWSQVALLILLQALPGVVLSILTLKCLKGPTDKNKVRLKEGRKPCKGSRGIEQLSCDCQQAPDGWLRAATAELRRLYPCCLLGTVGGYDEYR